MTIQIPAANIIIGSLYLLFLGVIFYVTKLSIKTKLNLAKTNFKYNKGNMKKALNKEKYYTNISQSKVLLKSLGLKYSVIGGILSSQKIYLLKEMLIVSILCVASTIINSIIFWPLTIAFPMLVLSFIYFEILLPREWTTGKVQEQNKQGKFQIEPEVSNVKMEESQNQGKKPLKLIFTVASISFITLILASESMVKLYGSISNLGLLNLGSVATMVAIDQILMRPSFCFLFLGAFHVIKKITGQTLFDSDFLLNICQNQILVRVNELQVEYETNDDLGMGVSPTKKESISPSKVPKAKLYFQQLTQMHMEITNRQEQNNLQQVVQSLQQDNKQSPIKDIKDLSMSQNSSLYFTSAEKKLFDDSQYLDVLDNVEEVKEDQRTLNPNHFFSAQRLPRQKQNTQQGIQDDGLVLVQTGLNAFHVKGDGKIPDKSKTLDVDFSPNKKARRFYGQKKNKRQLIITGNSPYLEYLPDMMKKADRPNRKNTTPSQPQIGTISRKVL